MGITIADMIFSPASKIRLHKTIPLSKLVGYVWVLGWLTWMMVWWVSSLMKARFGMLDDKQSIILEFFKGHLEMRHSA